MQEIHGKKITLRGSETGIPRFLCPNHIPDAGGGQTNSPLLLLKAGRVVQALDGSLEPLGVNCLALYLMHTPPKNHPISKYMDVMAGAVRQGKIQSIGVCNFSKDQIEEAAAALGKHNLLLSAVMVGYNILRRYGIFLLRVLLDVENELRL